MSWKRRLLIAAGCVAALVASAGGWVITQHDFDIREQRVTITGGAQPLQGTLALPKQGDGPFGLVVFVHGDGAATADRDEFYRPIWESFATAGYASLSWDKPGVAGAQGNWLDQTMHDRAVETEAAIAWARGRSEIDAGRIGLWGISQAGWVMPEVAVRHPELRFMIAVGTAVNWIRQGEYNLRAELRERHATDDELSAQLRRREAGLALLREGASYDRYRTTTTDSPPMSEDRWRFVSKNYQSDITEILPQLEVPTLLLLGERDLNVDVAETARVYRDSVPANLLAVKTFPDASHNIVKFDLDKPDGLRPLLVALFAPRSLYAPGYLDALREYVAHPPNH
ncbi:alpha/beta hydrolase family protein [Nocardia tengchongensis]|uniref:alpha/beta hydrolase family protein n=1 Tax=Nocardia tengchongensis TaxID=2055889 RepID=UPI0036C07F29